MERNDGSIGEHSKGLRRAKRHPLDLTLAGLPELGYFASDEEREQVLREIAAEGGNPKAWDFWLGVGLLVAVVCGAGAILGWLMRLVLWPPTVEQGLRIAGMALAFAVTIRRMHRGGFVTPLRGKLLARGFPICMKCGYLLRSLPLTSERCPECGRAFDDQVRRILSDAQAPPRT